MIINWIDYYNEPENFDTKQNISKIISEETTTKRYYDNYTEYHEIELPVAEIHISRQWSVYFITSKARKNEHCLINIRKADTLEEIMTLIESEKRICVFNVERLNTGKTTMIFKSNEIIYQEPTSYIENCIKETIK